MSLSISEILKSFKKSSRSVLSGVKIHPNSQGHFHFLQFVSFQTVFSVFSSNSHASTYFQIEAPSYYY